FKATKGKSDHKTLNRLKESIVIRAKLCAKKSPHLKDRDLRIPMASRIKMEKMLRSKAFPSSRVAATCPIWPPNHCEGSRDPMMKSQIRGTHRATEVPGSLAGS